MTGHVGISVVLTPEISPSNPSPNGPGSTSLTAATTATAAKASPIAESAPPPTNNDRDDAERARIRALLTVSRDPEKPTSSNDELVITLRSFAAREAEDQIGLARIDHHQRVLQHVLVPVDRVLLQLQRGHLGQEMIRQAGSHHQLEPRRRLGSEQCPTQLTLDPFGRHDLQALATERPGAFLFDTSKTGNSNAGHEYGKAVTSDEDRAALLEYLKSL